MVASSVYVRDDLGATWNKTSLPPFPSYATQGRPGPTQIATRAEETFVIIDGRLYKSTADWSRWTPVNPGVCFEEFCGFAAGEVQVSPSAKEIDRHGDDVPGVPPSRRAISGSTVGQPTSPGASSGKGRHGDIDLAI